MFLSCYRLDCNCYFSHFTNSQQHQMWCEFQCAQHWHTLFVLCTAVKIGSMWKNIAACCMAGHCQTLRHSKSRGGWEVQRCNFFLYVVHIGWCKMCYIAPSPWHPCLWQCAAKVCFFLQEDTWVTSRTCKGTYTNTHTHTRLRFKMTWTIHLKKTGREWKPHLHLELTSAKGGKSASMSAIWYKLQ